MQDRVAQDAIAREVDPELFETRRVVIVSGAVIDKSSDDDLTFRVAFGVGLAKSTLAEEEAGEHRCAGEHDLEAGMASDQGQHDRRRGNHRHEYVLHDSELAPLAHGHPEQKRRAGISQRGDEWCEHLETIT